MTEQLSARGRLGDAPATNDFTDIIHDMNPGQLEVYGFTYDPSLGGAIGGDKGSSASSVARQESVQRWNARLDAQSNDSAPAPTLAPPYNLAVFSNL